MHVTYAHLCDYANVSKEGKMNIMGVFDRIGALAVPYVHPMMFLAFEIAMHPAEVGHQFQMQFKLVDEDGKSVLEVQAGGKIDAVVQGGELVRFGQPIGMAGIPLTAFGKYSVDIFINGDHKTSVPFALVQGPLPQPGGLPGAPELPA